MKYQDWPSSEVEPVDWQVRVVLEIQQAKHCIDTTNFTCGDNLIVDDATVNVRPQKEMAIKDMESLADALQSNLRQLMTTKCWGIIAGSGTGSVLNLQFGAKIPRQKPLDNPTLRQDVRLFDAEYDLFIECVLRLDTNQEVICGAWDDNSTEGPMLEGLNNILEKPVTGITVLEPAWDVIIEFDDSFKLKIFCDQVNEEDENDNYSFFTPKQVITVGTRGKLQTEPRAK